MLRFIEIPLLFWKKNTTKQNNRNNDHTCLWYQRYHRFSLFTATTASYIGFSLLVIVRLVKNYTGIHTVGTRQNPSSLYGLNIVSLLAAFGAFVFVILQNLPVQFYLYFGCPVAVWHFVARDLMSFDLPVLSGIVASAFLHLILNPKMRLGSETLRFGVKS